MFAGIVGIVLIMAMMFVAAFVAVYLFKVDLVESVLGDLDLFWAERSFWAWTPRRRRRPKASGGKQKKRGAKQEADEANEAAIKAARWPYE